MSPFNLCCLYSCLYWVQLPTERFLGHTGFSTKELHTENLRPHSMKQKGAFASAWVNYLIVGWVGRMIMDKEWGCSTVSSITFQGVGGVLLSPPEASELMSHWSYKSCKSFGRKRNFGLQHIQLWKNTCTESKVLLSETRASKGGFGWQPGAENICWNIPTRELLLGAQ